MNIGDIGSATADIITLIIVSGGKRSILILVAQITTPLQRGK